jgi:hypothetical protein
MIINLKQNIEIATPFGLAMTFSPRLVSENLRKALREETIPLEPLPGHLLEEPFHHSLQKTGPQQE